MYSQTKTTFMSVINQCVEGVSHTNCGPSSGGVSAPVMSTCGNDNTNDYFADTHSNGTSHHEWLAADFVDEVDCWDGCSDVDDADDSGSEERNGTTCKTERLEDDRGVVDNY